MFFSWRWKKILLSFIYFDLGVILRDKLNVGSHLIPKDPSEQLKMLNEKGHDLSDFTDDKNIYSEIDSAVKELNGRFSNPEQLKKFSILPRDFTIDDGELTPTLKIRRKQISENWSSVIESMYKE